MHEHRQAEHRAGSDPPAAAAVAARLQREHRPPLQPREEHRVRATERRVEHRDRRNGRQQDDARRTAIADQLAPDQRDGRQRQAREDERRDAQRIETGPPTQQEVLEPEVERAAAALRRDDVEDVPERELRHRSVSSSSTLSGDHQTVCSAIATSRPAATTVAPGRSSRRGGGLLRVRYFERLHLGRLGGRAVRMLVGHVRLVVDALRVDLPDVVTRRLRAGCRPRAWR